MSRYNKGDIAFNDSIMYKNTFKDRGVDKIRQYRTQRFKNRNTDGIEYINHIWRDGDQFWKLSDEFYGDPKHWYIIAKFNNAPTESHVSIGDQIKIPLDLALALQVIV